MAITNKTKKLKSKKPAKASNKYAKKTSLKKAKSAKTGKELITKGMNINEIVSNHPSTIEVFFKHGFYCVGCQAAAFESLEQGAKAHGMSDEIIDQMVKEMNEAAQKK